MAHRRNSPRYLGFLLLYSAEPPDFNQKNRVQRPIEQKLQNTCIIRSNNTCINILISYNVCISLKKLKSRNSEIFCTRMWSYDLPNDDAKRIFGKVPIFRKLQVPISYLIIETKVYRLVKSTGELYVLEVNPSLESRVAWARSGYKGGKVLVPLLDFPGGILDGMGHHGTEL